MLQPANSSVQPTALPTPSGVPLPGTGISQQASDLLPIASGPAPAPLLAQTESPRPPAEAPTTTSDAATETNGLAKAAQNPIANLISVQDQQSADQYFPASLWLCR